MSIGSVGSKGLPIDNLAGQGATEEARVPRKRTGLRTWGL